MTNKVIYRISALLLQWIISSAGDWQVSRLTQGLSDAVLQVVYTLKWSVSVWWYIICFNKQIKITPWVQCSIGIIDLEYIKLERPMICFSIISDSVRYQS